MKQRIRVVGIIRTGEGILILKRNRGRSETPVFWELPTGKIKFGEQPEESITRTLKDYVGLTATSVAIKDVITFMALEDASRLSNLYIIYEVTVDGSEKLTPKDRYTAYKFVKDLTSINLRLSEPTTSVLEIIEGKISTSHIDPRSTANSVTIHVDGASRGNPGPSGIGFCVYDVDGKLLKHGGEFIGFATSRVAEYYAMKKGIELALEMNVKSARFFSDSLMVVNQLNGIFKVKNQDVAPIYAQIQQLLSYFDSVSFTHISRTENSLADREANQAIDNILNV